jgi:regulator of protease activity HflC (stomatin/prohibitin superfamily)
MTIVMGVVAGFVAWFWCGTGGRHLHGQPGRAGGEDEFWPGRTGRPWPPFSKTQSPSICTPRNVKRYAYPQVRLIPPGGPYFKWPWEKVYKVPSRRRREHGVRPGDALGKPGRTLLEAVTKDQLNTGLTGQIRYRVSEKNLYAYLFGVKRPIVHIMGYFTSVLRERIANFEAPRRPPRKGRFRPRRAPPRPLAFPSMTCGRTCGIITSTWTANAALPRRDTALF